MKSIAITCINYTDYLITYDQYLDYAISITKVYSSDGEDKPFSKSYLEKNLDFIFSAISKEN